MNRMIAVSTGVLVTILWSTSYILNVYVFREGLGPITLAGLRYSIAVFFLWVFSLIVKGKKSTADVKTPLKLWHYLFLGLTGFIIAQGLQYVGQSYVTPTQTGLVLNIGNTLLVLLIDAIWLKESQNSRAYIGIVGTICGVLMFYYPWSMEKGNIVGIAFIAASSVGYAVNLTATRYFISVKNANPRDIILRSMLLGALGMTIIGLLKEGMPAITLHSLLILLWLGAVNGALAFYLWTWTQKTLHSFESSIINNLMLLEITILDVIMLNRSLSSLKIAGLVITGSTIAFVQLYPHFKKILCQKRAA